MHTAWVVVADHSRARIFAAEKPADKLVEIQTLTYPEARLHDADLISDRPGRDNGRNGCSHGLGNNAEHKNDLGNRFAGSLCDTLEKGRNHGDFEHLYIIAEPSFLGQIRKRQSPTLRRQISAEIAKNLTARDPQTIRAALPQFL